MLLLEFCESCLGVFTDEVTLTEEAILPSDGWPTTDGVVNASGSVPILTGLFNFLFFINILYFNWLGEGSRESSKISQSDK